MSRRSPRGLQPVVLGVTALAVFLCYGFDTHPLYGDRAYLVYQAQTVLRGDSMYAHSFFGYPPLGALLSAAAMAIGGWLEVPTYLAPRYASLALGVANVLLLYTVTRRATGSAAAGLAAALTLTTIAEYAGFAVGTLEPKSLVIGFSLAASACVQRRRFGFAGAFAGLAATCWQPAVLVPAALLCSVVAGSPHRRLRAVGAFFGGATVALLPSLVYLGVHDAWLDFFQRAVVIPAGSDLPGASTEPLFWLRVAATRFATDLHSFALGATGFAVFAFTTLRRGAREAAHTWLDTRLGGVPLLTALWIGFNTVDFQGTPDMLPILASVGFFAGWLLGWALQEAGPRRRIAVVGVAAAALVWGLADAVRFRPAATLADQLATVRQLVGRDGGRSVLAFDADAVYALAERAAPVPFLRMNRFFTPFATLVSKDGCPALLATALEDAPDIVVIRRFAYQSPCVYDLGGALEAEGYRGIEMHFRFARHHHFEPRTSDKIVVWDVYRRPGA